MSETNLNQSNLKTSPTISIGMPVYNGEKFIREALNSLLAQTFTDFELLISDNASTDATEKICQDYATKDARIRYFRQSANVGAIANFQRVLNCATGLYFMWAAHDDIWSLDWLEQLHKKMAATEAGITFGSVIHIDSTGALMNHPANHASFQFTGKPLYRRIKFFLAAESQGKANTIYSLYKKEMFPHLNTILEEFHQKTRFYDYTVVYSSLQYQELEKADNTFLYKRIHNANEGADSRHTDDNKLIYLLKKIQRRLWPFLPNLLFDYLTHSSLIEKILLLLFIPVKLFNHYWIDLNRIISKLKNN